MAAGWVMPGSRAKLTWRLEASADEFLGGTRAFHASAWRRRTDRTEDIPAAARASWQIQSDGYLPHLIGHLCNFLNADWSWDSCLLYRSSKITKFTWCNQIKPTSRSVETSPVRGIMRQTVEYYYRQIQPSNRTCMCHNDPLYCVCVCITRWELISDVCDEILQKTILFTIITNLQLKDFLFN